MESLGIMGFDSYHFAVENLERSKSFYREKLDFDEVARASDRCIVCSLGSVPSTPAISRCSSRRTAIRFWPTYI